MRWFAIISLIVCGLGVKAMPAPGEDKFWDLLESMNDTLPEKWKKESAVFLKQGIYEHMSVSGGNTRITYSEVLLNDYLATSEYSELYFGEEIEKFEIKVIRPSGDTINVSESDAVDASSDGSEQKIAIPGLTEGCVLIVKTFMNDPSQLINHLTVEELKEAYPIVSKVLYFNVAPRLGKVAYVENGLKMNHETPGGEMVEHHFYHQARYLDAVNYEERWTKEEVKNPHFKVAVKAKGIGYNKFDVLNQLGKKHEMITGYDEKEYLAAISKNIKKDHKLPASYLLNKYQYSRWSYSNEEPKVKLNSLMHYFSSSRSPIFSEATDEFDWSNLLNDYLRSGIQKDFVRGRDLFFLAWVIRAIKSEGWHYEVGVFHPDGNLDLSKIVDEDELRYFIRVKGFYLFSPYPGEGVNNIPSYASGQDAIIFKPAKKPAEIQLKREKLPIRKVEDNMDFREIDLTLNLDSNSIIGEEKIKIIGALKVNRFLSVNILKQVQKGEREISIAERCEESIREHMKRSLRNSGANEMEVQDVECLSLGIPQNYNDLSMLDEIELSVRYKDTCYAYEYEDMRMVNLGRFIGDQVKINFWEKERKSDVVMSTARQFRNKITCNIPEGYTVEGLESMNVNVDNEYSSFSCTAKEQDGKIIIESEKVYKNNHVPKEEWSKLVEMLDAAYEVTQKRVLFKKIKDEGEQ